MFVRLRIGIVIGSLLFATTSSRALDGYLRAASSAPTAITLCGEDGNQIKTAVCKEKGYDLLVAAIDRAFDGALARTPANVRPLLKRDEAWFNEMILQAAGTVEEVDDDELRESFLTTLRLRAVALEGIAAGFGRSGLAGKWSNAFGSVILTPDGDDAWHLAIDMRVDYGSNRRRQCQLSTAVTRSGGWLNGKIASTMTRPAKPPEVKLRRQGETLRVVITERDEMTGDREDCDYLWQITGTYFANGNAETTDKADTSFVAPTFDCTRPETATDEEICADPDLAQNDQRLNRAWKALLPRLDDATRRALTEDQRNWVHAQAVEFPEFLHPAWDKRNSEMHATADARAHVDGLQRERIALLEGFDDKRTGLAGVWLAYNAIIKITVDKDGRLKAKGWKWDQGDWKAGCDYDMSGKAVSGVFHSDEQRKNPDTLERDHAMLIVNRLDDVFSKSRSGKDSADEAKCRRRLDSSSTARLFPARDSPDIDNFSGSIR
ncbi:MAG: DUF1311 domain-containing protein [Bradyrhizobium sp.]|uniref:lysozyme inhibitor LprI family protein n=1 Tax=Bradyrhizobium sp. TaxID=376 RepID=UPI001A320D5D|nr:lysozyme inhibitor LprI family protein [Bradyrhizobium sp.]MBJ7404496.1 DUF1311 domain-containing protein [Bradyrhizobium sp.]